MMRINRYGLLLAVLLAPAAAMAQDGRVVDLERAVLNSDAGIAAQAMMNAKLQEKRREFEAKRKEIDDAKAELTGQTITWSSKVKAEKVRKIEQMQKDFVRGLEDTDAVLDKLRKELLDPVIKVARREIDKLAAEKSYVIIESSSGTSNPKLDVTNELIDRINSAMNTGATEPVANPVGRQ